MLLLKISGRKILLEIIYQIPEWLGTGLLTALSGVIGWFGHVLFLAWRKSRLPFKQDKQRYEYIIEGLDTGCIYFNNYAPMEFEEEGRIFEIHCIPDPVIENIRKNIDLLESVRLPAYLDGQLAEKEQTLIQAYQHLQEIMASTIYHDHEQNAYALSDNDDREYELEEISDQVKTVIAAYEAYRDYGNRRFAERILL